MVEAVMYSGIGFFLASAMALALVPLVHARAVRLTTRRIAADAPSTAEMVADKDQARAKFALAARRYEVNIEQMKIDTASKLADFGKRGETITKLKQEVGAKGETIAKLESEIGANGKTIAKLENKLGMNSEKIAKLENEIATKSVTIAKFESELSEKDVAIRELKARARPATPSALAPKGNPTASAKARRAPAASTSRSTGDLANRMRALQSLQNPTTAATPATSPAQPKTRRSAPRRSAPRRGTVGHNQPLTEAAKPGRRKPGTIIPSGMSKIVS